MSLPAKSLPAARPSPAPLAAAQKTALTVVVATKVLTEVAATEAAASATALLPIGCVALGDVAQPARHLLAGLRQHLLQRPAEQSSRHSSEAACQRTVCTVGTRRSRAGGYQACTCCQEGHPNMRWVHRITRNRHSHVTAAPRPVHTAGGMARQSGSPGCSLHQQSTDRGRAARTARASNSQGFPVPLLLTFPGQSHRQ